MIEKEECNVMDVTSTENMVKVCHITNSTHVRTFVIVVIINIIVLILVITFMQGIRSYGGT